MFVEIVLNRLYERLLVSRMITIGAVLGMLGTAGLSAQVAGALGNGFGGAAAGRGGTMTAESSGPLDAMEGNPAGLAAIDTRMLEVGGVAAIASGSFQNSSDRNGRLLGTAGAIPYGAFASPVGSSRWRAAVAVSPDALMRADWQYVDPPGTAGASYGLCRNESEIVAIRSSLGVGRAVGSKWAVGASLGLVYNSNTLNAPYIFQQQPQVAGLKVLLDLRTRGFGWNGSAGAQWQATRRLRLGMAWKSATLVQSHGTVSGTASAQFAALGIDADPEFQYRAEVDNHLPVTAAGGVSSQVNRRIRLGCEGDFIQWDGAFRRLPVKLTQGSNATINSVVGQNSLNDAVPLNWHSQFALRAGDEMPIAEHWTVRVGYVYMSNPVPTATLTPLTAAILRNVFTSGAGWSRGRWALDMAYQAQLPASGTVARSSLLAGEYDNSHLQVGTQSLAATTSVHF